MQAQPFRGTVARRGAARRSATGETVAVTGWNGPIVLLQTVVASTVFDYSRSHTSDDTGRLAETVDTTNRAFCIVFCGGPRVREKPARPRGNSGLEQQ